MAMKILLPSSSIQLLKLSINLSPNTNIKVKNHLSMVTNDVFQSVQFHFNIMNKNPIFISIITLIVISFTSTKLSKRMFMPTSLI